MTAEREAVEVLALARELARLNGGDYDFLRERKQQEYRTTARHVIASDWLAAALAAAAGTTREAEAWDEVRVMALGATDWPYVLTHRNVFEMEHPTFWEGITRYADQYPDCIVWLEQRAVTDWQTYRAETTDD